MMKMMKTTLKPTLLVLAALFILPIAPSPSWAESGKPKYGPQITPLSHSYEYFQKQPQSSFWSWIPYYIPQRDGRSCSLASVTMLLNSARSQMKLTQTDPLVTQDDLFKRINSPIWNQGLGHLGRGVNLDQLGELVRLSLKSYKIPFDSVEVIHIDNDSEGTQNLVHQALLEMEKSKNTLILANFLMSIYTEDAEVGHISPVGAYDSEKKQVLILDSDRKWYEPYWVSEKTFLKGMATEDSDSKKKRGFVRVRLSESPQKSTR